MTTPDKADNDGQVVLRQASCVLLDGQAVLIEGEPGAGKSSLALALIDRGALLIGDDGVRLHLRDGHLWASPPPNISGKLEVRNVGIIDLPVSEGPVALILRLTDSAPRYVETPQHQAILGIQVPVIELFPDTPALPLRAQWAVRKYATRR